MNALYSNKLCMFLRSQISAPLDLLSESLASSTSLISHLMKQNANDRKEGGGGPVASALLASKQTRRMSANPRFKMRRRQPTTSTPIDRNLDIGVGNPTREPLVITCDDPEGCATPISGAKVKIMSNTRFHYILSQVSCACSHQSL